jgi:hypothetical protein
MDLARGRLAKAGTDALPGTLTVISHKIQRFGEQLVPILVFGGFAGGRRLFGSRRQPESGSRAVCELIPGALLGQCHTLIAGTYWAASLL